MEGLSFLLISLVQKLLAKSAVARSNEASVIKRGALEGWKSRSDALIAWDSHKRININGIKRKKLQRDFPRGAKSNFVRSDNREWREHS